MTDLPRGSETRGTRPYPTGTLPACYDGYEFLDPWMLGGLRPPICTGARGGRFATFTPATELQRHVNSQEVKSC